MERNAAIDISRAIAVLLVTSLHVSRVSWLPSIDIGQFDALGFMRNGWVGVGIFFVISGYCMGMTTKGSFEAGINFKGYAKYISKRFLRIAPAYYFSILVWVLIINVYNINPKPTGMKDIISHLTFTHNMMPETIYSISGVFWSIAVEMQFYIILPVVISLCCGVRNDSAVIVFSFLMTLIITVSELPNILKLSLANYLFLFLYGYFLFKYKNKSIKVASHPLFFYCAISLFVTLLSFDGIDSMNKLYEAFASVTYGLIMIGLDYRINKDGMYVKALCMIGKASFSIYLYNYIYGVVIVRVDNHLSLLFMLLGTVAFGIMMYLLVEVNAEKLRVYIFKRNKNKTLTNKGSSIAT